MAMEMAAGLTKDFYDVVIAKRFGADAWNVEAVDEEGGIEQAIFTGPLSEERATEYAKYSYGV